MRIPGADSADALRDLGDLIPKIGLHWPLSLSGGSTDNSPYQGPFGAPSEVEPPSAVGVAVGVDFIDLALKMTRNGGAERR